MRRSSGAPERRSAGAGAGAGATHLAHTQVRAALGRAARTLTREVRKAGKDLLAARTIRCSLFDVKNNLEIDYSFSASPSLPTDAPPMGI